MDREPVVVKESTREWETWPDEDVSKRGLVYWKTLVSGDLTHSEALTMGIAMVPPSESLREHRHRQAEIYLVLQGTGSVTIDGKTRPVAAGSAVFIPGDALHSCENPGASDLQIAYVFPANSSEEVEYVFDEYRSLRCHRTPRKRTRVEFFGGLWGVLRHSHEARVGRSV